MRRVDRILVGTLLPDHPALLASARAAVLDAAAAFVGGQIGRAPAHVRLGVRVLGLALLTWLALHGVLRAPAPYRQAAPALARFQALGAPFAGVLRVYRSMALLAFYEHPLVEAALGFEDPVARQAAFRALRARRVAA
jgi:hypothetical protein